MSGNTAWTAARAPLPKNAGAKPTVDLFGVSCASGTCTAVGNYQVGSSGGSTEEKALIETLPNGTASSAKAQSLQLENDSALQGVYCVSAGSCLALGGFGSNGLQSGLAVAEQLGGVRRPWNVENESGRIHVTAPAPDLLAA